MQGYSQQRRVSRPAIKILSDRHQQQIALKSTTVTGQLHRLVDNARQTVVRQRLEPQLAR
jgi:hypothetical protein